MRADDRVAILALNSDRFLEYYLAVWWAGGAVNPVNTRWAVREIVYSLKDSHSSVLFVDKNYRSLIEEIRVGTNSLKHVIYLDDDDAPPNTLCYEQPYQG